jgi:hypothetical protein
MGAGLGGGESREQQHQKRNRAKASFHEFFLNNQIRRKGPK